MVPAKQHIPFVASNVSEIPSYHHSSHSKKEHINRKTAYGHISDGKQSSETCWRVRLSSSGKLRAPMQAYFVRLCAALGSVVSQPKVFTLETPI